MKKKFVLFSAACLLLFSSKTEAQSTGQIRAGVNFANVSTKDDGSVNDANSLTSVHVGFVGDVPLAGKYLSLQPGIIFTGKGSKIQRGDANSSAYFKQSTNPYYLEVPVNFVFKALLGGDNKFFIGAGPYAAVGIAGRTKTEGRSILGSFDRDKKIRFSNDDPSTFSEEEGTGLGVLKRFDYGVNGIVGLEGKTLVVGVNYGLGLAKLQSGTDNNKDNDNKHRVLAVTLGFKF